jgi:hypothetical protein
MQEPPTPRNSLYPMLGHGRTVRRPCLLSPGVLAKRQKRLREAAGRGFTQTTTWIVAEFVDDAPLLARRLQCDATERRSPAWDLSRHRTVRYSTASTELQRGFRFTGCAAGRNRIAGGAEFSLFDDLHLWFGANQQAPPPWGKVGVRRHMAQDGWNWRFAIVDCRMLIDGGGCCNTSFSTGNQPAAAGQSPITDQQSPIKTRSSVAAMPRCVDCVRGSETRSTPYRAFGSPSSACALSTNGVIWYTSVSKDWQREFGLRGWAAGRGRQEGV